MVVESVERKDAEALKIAAKANNASEKELMQEGDDGCFGAKFTRTNGKGSDV